MKANNGSGNISDRDNWETPQELFNKLNEQYHFDFDCCANVKNYKCYHYANDFELGIPFNGCYSTSGWMNPPFSMACKMFIHFFQTIKHGVAIYRCDNLETGIWQKVIFPNCDWVFFPKGRVNFEGLDGMGSRFPSALIGVGVEPPKYLEGVTVKIN